MVRLVVQTDEWMRLPCLTYSLDTDFGRFHVLLAPLFDCIALLITVTSRTSLRGPARGKVSRALDFYTEI